MRGGGNIVQGRGSKIGGDGMVAQCEMEKNIGSFFFLLLAKNSSCQACGKSHMIESTIVVVEMVYSIKATIRL